MRIASFSRSVGEPQHRADRGHPPRDEAPPERVADVPQRAQRAAAQPALPENLLLQRLAVPPPLQQC